jgi:hypothetical protein
MPNFLKAYRRNTQVLGIEYNKRIKLLSEAFDADQEVMTNVSRDNNWLRSCIV